MTQKEEIFVGLDVGSSKITCVVGKQEGEEHLSIIGVGTSYMTGLRKGVVTEIEETVSGISEAIEVAERMAGVDISSASVNVNGPSISSLNSSGVVAVGRADQQITAEDADRAEEAAQAVQISSNKEILHVFPRVFKVDEQDGIKDPIGMNGIRLEVETHIVKVGSQPSRNLHKVVSQAGVKLKDEIATPLASAKAVTKKRQRDLGCVVVDIGAATTGIAVFEEGEVFHTSVIPFGGLHITNDIAIGLRTSIDIAEKVKIKYGNGRRKGVSEKTKIDLSEIDIKEEGTITKRHIAEIIEARLEEILRMVRERLMEVGREALLPAGVIITGGTARMEGVEEKAKEVLKLPIEIGMPQNLTGLTDKVYDPTMSVAVGLLLYNYEEATSDSGRISRKDFFGGPLKFLQKIFKTFLP